MKLGSKSLRISCVKGIAQLYLPSTRLSKNGMSDPAFTPSRTASPHFGQYSFPVPQRIGGWVGLGGWLHTEVVCPPEDVLVPTDRLYGSQGSNSRVLSRKSDDLTTRLRSHTPQHDRITRTTEAVGNNSASLIGTYRASCSTWLICRRDVEAVCWSH